MDKISSEINLISKKVRDDIDYTRSYQALYVVGDLFNDVHLSPPHKYNIYAYIFMRILQDFATHAQQKTSQQPLCHILERENLSNK